MRNRELAPHQIWANEPFLPDVAKDEAHLGPFDPLSTALERELYCSKLTLRNFNFICISIVCHDSIPPSIIKITANPKLAEDLAIAYRNSAPPEYQPLRPALSHHEYIIDGGELKNEGVQSPVIVFHMNPSTGIQLTLKDLKGMVVAENLEEEQFLNIVRNECGANVNLRFCPPIKPLMGMRPSR